MKYPYRGRPKPKFKAKAAGGAALSLPTRQSDNRLTSTTKTKVTDVTDPWLRGQASPYSMAHDVDKKK